MTRAGAFVGLVRWPGALTAAGNAATCFLIAHRPDSPGGRAAALGAVLGAALVYSGGVVLNDVADATKDATLHPTRPIPSGAVPRAAAAKFGVALLVAGIAAVALLANAEAGAFAAAAAISAVLYDFVGARVRAAGMVFLGLARALNAATGAVAAAGGAAVVLDLARFPTLAQLHPIALFAYTAVLTWISTFEDDRTSRSTPGALAAVLFVVAAFSWSVFPRTGWSGSPAIAFVFLAATLASAAGAARDPDGPGIGAVVRAGVFGFVLVDAAWLFGVGRFEAGFYGILVYVLLRLVLMRTRS